MRVTLASLWRKLFVRDIFGKRTHIVPHGGRESARALWLACCLGSGMKKNSFYLASLIAVALFAPDLSAGTIKLPEKGPLVSIEVPDSWKPEETDKGFACESPDSEATVIFEVTSAKKLDALIDENVEWLTEQKVTIDKSTQVNKDFKAAGMDWSVIGWDGKNDEYGPASIRFGFVDIGNGKILMITYWVTKKGEAKQQAVLNKMFDSVKKIGG
jgi:hypothetical protein